MRETEQVVNAAGLAAEAIASASGITSLEAVASELMALKSRVAELEGLAPMVDDIINTIPKSFVSDIGGFVDRVEGFFAKHFPMHAAQPAAEQKPE